MWIVRLALRQPYTFPVATLLILILGVASYVAMPKDILPTVDIPVVSVVWSYAGLPPQEMERRFVSISERAMNTTVNDIEHQESQSYSGVAVIKVFFHPDVKMEQAVAQITAVSQTLLHSLPAGATPPLIVEYNASAFPILQLAVSSATLTESELFDQSLNFIRRPLAEVRGASIPLPFGGKQRLVSVDLDLRKCQALNIAPIEVGNAVNEQNVVLPSGTVKIGDREYNVLLNNSPDLLDQLNNIPVKQSGGSTIFIHDVAQVRDGYAPQTNIVKVNGEKSVLLSILKTGFGSTVDVVNGINRKLSYVRTQIPRSINIRPLFDQSLFVSAALRGLLIEGATAAAVTALMILLFLGSWRSMLIVGASIPIAVCCSILLLAAMGQTLNIMTLGGLALAVGILVDDTIVTVENIHRQLKFGKRRVQAILDGAQQIAGPAFVSTFCICVVLIPVFFLGGVTYFLFSPLALAVIFALLASYLISRTVAPSMANFLLREAVDRKAEPPTASMDFHHRLTRGFEWIQEGYAGFLKRCLSMPGLLIFTFVIVAVLALAVFTPFLGRDFFPVVDSGQFRLHIRAPSGTRIEQTEKGFAQIEKIVREVIPPSEFDLVLDEIGLPVGGVNLAVTDSATIGSFDGEMLVSLKPGHHPTGDYVREIRHRLRYQMPDYEFFTQPSDLVEQMLSFGLPSPIDVQVTGPEENDKADYGLAKNLVNRLRNVRGAVDVHLQQVVSSPTLFVNLDRTRASEIGLTQRDVANDLLISLSSSGQVSPNYWINPVNGVSYEVAVQTPQYAIESLDALKKSPISAGKLATPQLLGNLAPITRIDSPAVISHYDIAPAYDVLLNVQGRDWGGVADDVRKIIGQYGVGATVPAYKIPAGSQLQIRGQIERMDRAYKELGWGLLAAVVLIFLLLVVHFQSWLDPIIIISALPGGLAGIVGMLFLTNTPVSVPALMGAIMCMGVATANSVLVVSFANDERLRGRSLQDAAIAAGRTRLRPVLMTAMAIIFSMLPIALGWGEGGELNAPFGRAVIGGLFVATIFTLIFVPAVYSVVRRKDLSRDIDPLLREDGSYDETDDVDFTISKNAEKTPVSDPEGYSQSRIARS